MIRMFCSNSTDRLYRQLANQVEKFRQQDLWAPIIITTPDSYAATQCKLAVSRVSGIASNIITLNDFKQLFSWLFTSDTNCCQLISVNMLQQFILGCLGDWEWFVSHPEMEQLGEYLGLNGNNQFSANNILTETKRFEVSKNLALLFQIYEQYRPQMVAKWLAEGQPQYSYDDPQEKWQAAIYREIFQTGGRRDSYSEKHNINWRQLSEIYNNQGVLENLLAQHQPALTGLHIFATPSDSPLYMNLLNKISATGVNINIYNLSICKEYWEDIPTSKKARHAAIIGGPVNAPLALQFWGAAGRQYQKLLEDLDIAEYSDDFTAAPPAASLLESLKNDIFNYQVPENNKHLSLDKTLTIHKSYYAKREVEEVLSRIGYQLLEAHNAKESLHFNDLAIILPPGDEQQKYKQLLAAQAEQLELPLVYVGKYNIQESQLFQAVDALMALPGSDFTRSAMLAVMNNPLVRCHFPNANPDKWNFWCEKLAIFHDTDVNNPLDIYNWQQGFKRLLLGWYLPDNSHTDDPIVINNNKYFPADIIPGDATDISTFLLLANSLKKQAEDLLTNNYNLEEWCLHITDYLSSFLCCQEENEQRLYNKLLGTIERLKNLSIPENKINYYLFKKLFMEELSSISATYHAPVTEGIVVGTLKELRPNNFKYIYMLSLGNNLYPTTTEALPFDLRVSHPQTDDINSRQWQLYHFLEMICGDLSRLDLNYLFKDDITGDDRQPSPIIDDLLFILQKHYLTKETCQDLVVVDFSDHYDARCFTAANVLLAPYAYKECQARKLHFAVKNPVVEKPADLWPDYNSKLLPPKIPYRLQLTTADLVKFLKSPIQQYGRTLFKKVDYESKQFCDQEPLKDDKWFKDNLSQSLFDAICNKTSLEDINQQILTTTEKAQYKGEIPSGLLLEDFNRKCQDEWAAKYEFINKYTKDHNFHYYRFGESIAAQHKNIPAVTLTPVQIKLNFDNHEHLVEISGTSVLFNNDNEPVYLSLSAGVNQYNLALKALLDSALLLVSGGLPKITKIVNLIFFEKTKKINNISLINLPDAEAALRWLTDLITDYYCYDHECFLPIEAAVEILTYKLKDKNYDNNYQNFYYNWTRWWQKNVLCEKNQYNTLASDYGVVLQPRRYAKAQDLESYTQYYNLVRKRFAPLWGVEIPTR